MNEGKKLSQVKPEPLLSKKLNRMSAGEQVFNGGARRQ